MEKCAYEQISKENVCENKSTSSWKPLLRQLLVCSGTWTMYILPGLFTGVPPVFVAQTRRDANSTEAVSSEMVSWLSSAMFYAAVPWVVILSIFAHFFGRKISFLLISINAIASYTLLFLSQNAKHVLISEIMASMSLAAHSSVAILILSEYSSPRYRGVFLTLKSATSYWATWVANIIGIFSHWRNIGIVGLVSCILCAPALFWPESPYWLASKGKMEECAASHRWLKGVDSDSEKELQILLKRSQNVPPKKSSSLLNAGRNIIGNIKKRANYRPVLVSFPLIALYDTSGKLICVMYILEMIKELTRNEKTAYLAMLLLDGVTVVGMYLGCIASKFLNRRTILLGFSFIGIVFLYIISSYLYLVKLAVINKSSVVLLSLLTGYTICISIGPTLMITTVFAEILPLKFQHEACIIGGFFRFSFSAVMLKCAPYIFIALGLHGSFLFFAISSSVIIVILYKYLPETKDKTLQEISDWFKGQGDDRTDCESESFTLS